MAEFARTCGLRRAPGKDFRWLMLSLITPAASRIAQGQSDSRMSLAPNRPTYLPRELTPEQREHAFWMQITMFLVSTALVGVCLTTISMIVVIENLSGYSTLCDARLAVDALLFLFAASAKGSGRPDWHRRQTGGTGAGRCCACPEVCRMLRPRTSPPPQADPGPLA
jgi:hypothetical protein